MPRKKIQRITAWSFSRYSTYTKCAFLAKLKFIDKLKEKVGPALIRGKDIHTEAELYSIGQTNRRPKSLDLFAEEFKHLRTIKKKLQTEKQLAVTRNWESSDWFGGDTWLRAVIDCMYVDGDTLKIIDYKTGKIREESMEQLDLYAIVGFIHGPAHITRVECEFWYLDQGEVKDRSYTRAQAVKLRSIWIRKTKKMLADVTFKPTPSADACRWCQFKKSKNGPCKF